MAEEVNKINEVEETRDYSFEVIDQGSSSEKESNYFGPAEFNGKPVLSGDNLLKIACGYYYDPQNIESYPVNAERIGKPQYKYVFKALQTLYDTKNKGTEKVRTFILNELKDTIYSKSFGSELTDRQKKDIYEFFIEAESSRATELNANNIGVNYEQYQKELTLCILKEQGEDISDVWANDPKNKGEGVFTDTAASLAADLNYRTLSVKELGDRIVARANKHRNELNSETKTKFSGAVIKRGREIPGADKKIVSLIGTEDKCFMELGSFNSIIAPAKCGKTQLAMEIAYAVQNGLPLFGYETMQSDVLYVDFELRPAQIADRLEKLDSFYQPEIAHAVKKPVDPYYCSVSSSFSNMEVDLDGIIQTVENFKTDHKEVRLIFFDCFYTFLEGDGNSEEDAKNTLLKLKQLVDDDTTVVYVHHTNKSGTKKMSDGDIIYAAGGSGVHGKIIDTTYVIRPAKGTRQEFKICATGRSVSGIEFTTENNEKTCFFFKRKEGEDDDIQEPTPVDTAVTRAKNLYNLYNNNPKLFNYFRSLGPKGITITKKESSPMTMEKEGLIDFERVLGSNDTKTRRYDYLIGLGLYGADKDKLRVTLVNPSNFEGDLSSFETQVALIKMGEDEREE